MTDNEDRLREALRAGSGQRQADDADWAAFQHRLARDPSRREPRTQRWRVPAIAAAAVIAIAVATSAVVTHGFGIGGQQAASSGAATTRWAEGVAVPIAPASQIIRALSGQAVGSGVGPDASSPPVPSAQSRTSAGAVSPASIGSVAMAFIDGTPPQAALHGTFTYPDGATTSGGSHRSDGTPLGYLVLSGGSIGTTAKGARYLWGAVGPMVLQVQISDALSLRPGNHDPRFSGGTAYWQIGTGKGTSWSVPDASTTVWTDLGQGWHGFAVRLPAGSLSASVNALGAGGRLLQIRNVTVATGGFSDALVATTGMPPSKAALIPASPGGSEYAPPSATPSISEALVTPDAAATPDTTATAVNPGTTSASEIAAGATGSPGEADTGCPLTGGSGFGASDSGFNANGIQFSADPHSPVVCFFDGVSTWNLTRTTKPLVAAVTGVGTFLSMVEGAKPTKGRIVWGAVGSEVASVHVAAGQSGTHSVSGSTVIPGVRVFYTRVPATGSVTVTAEGADGTVLGTTIVGRPTR